MRSCDCFWNDDDDVWYYHIDHSRGFVGECESWVPTWWECDANAKPFLPAVTRRDSVCSFNGDYHASCRTYSTTQLEQRTDEAVVGGESPTHYHLLGRVSRASTDSTAHSFFIHGLKSEIANLQEEGITLHTSISAIFTEEVWYGFCLVFWWVNHGGYVA